MVVFRVHAFPERMLTEHLYTCLKYFPVGGPGHVYGSVTDPAEFGSGGSGASNSSGKGWENFILLSFLPSFYAYAGFQWTFGGPLLLASVIGTDMLQVVASWTCG